MLPGSGDFGAFVLALDEVRYSEPRASGGAGDPSLDALCSSWARQPTSGVSAIAFD